MILFEVVNCREGGCKIYAIGSSPSRCHLLDFLNDLEANYHTNRDGLYALFDLTAEKGLDMIKGKSAYLRNGVFRVREGNLRVFWFYDQDKVVICTHGAIKKSQKTKRDDLEYALELKKLYFSLDRTQIPIIKYED